MGVSKAMISLFCETRKEISFKGNVLQLGKQDVDCNSVQLTDIFKKFGYPSPFISDGPIDDIALFRALGFTSVESLDASDYEGADIVWDLNKAVPDSLKAKYDVVFDGGTSEHVFNFPQVLKNIYDVLKPDGVVIHASPSHNHVDHGFYMFSPTVFYDFYTANKFEILKSYIFEFKPEPDSEAWRIYDYKPGVIDHLSFGGWGNDLLGIFFVARKTSLSTGHITPQQGTYTKAWKQSNADAPLTGAVRRPSALNARIKSLVSRWPKLYAVLVRLYAGSRAKRRPVVVARY